MLQPIDTKSAPKLNLFMIVVSFLLAVLAIIWLRAMPINQNVPIVASTSSITVIKRSSPPKLYPASVNSYSGVSCSPGVGSKNVVLTIKGSRLTPSCQIVASSQVLEVNNQSNRKISASLASQHFSIYPGRNYLNQLSFGKYLALGVHLVNINGVGSVKLWLK